MAEVTLHVFDLIGPHESWPVDDQGALFIQFPADTVERSKELRRLWIYVLLVAVRDNATSVHCHAEPASGTVTLCYTLDNVRYEFTPPPPGYATAILAAARSLLTPPHGRFALFNCRRPNSTTSSIVTLDLGGAPIVWDAVCWSVGIRAGVELYRVTPLDRPSTTSVNTRHPCE